MDKQLITDNKELNQKCIDELITRLQDIDDTSSVGVIAAQDIIDIVIENLGPEIYNKAINDVNKIFETKTEDLKYEIEELRRE